MKKMSKTHLTSEEVVLKDEVEARQRSKKEARMSQGKNKKRVKKITMIALITSWWMIITRQLKMFNLPFNLQSEVEDAKQLKKKKREEEKEGQRKKKGTKEEETRTEEETLI